MNIKRADQPENLDCSLRRCIIISAVLKAAKPVPAASHAGLSRDTFSYDMAPGMWLIFIKTKKMMSLVFMKYVSFRMHVAHLFIHVLLNLSSEPQFVTV